MGIVKEERQSNKNSSHGLSRGGVGHERLRFLYAAYFAGSRCEVYKQSPCPQATSSDVLSAHESCQGKLNRKVVNNQQFFGPSAPLQFPKGRELFSKIRKSPLLFFILAKNSPFS
jgi:hypothetical protein